MCQASKTSNGHLLSHVATNHCKEEIYLQYDRNQRQCKICGKEAKTYSHLVSFFINPITQKHINSRGSNTESSKTETIIIIIVLYENVKNLCVLCFIVVLMYHIKITVKRAHCDGVVKKDDMSTRPRG